MPRRAPKIRREADGPPGGAQTIPSSGTMGSRLRGLQQAATDLKDAAHFMSFLVQGETDAELPERLLLASEFRTLDPDTFVATFGGNADPPAEAEEPKKSGGWFS